MLFYMMKHSMVPIGTANHSKWS